MGTGGKKYFLFLFFVVVVPRALGRCTKNTCKHIMLINKTPAQPPPAHPPSRSRRWEEEEEEEEEEGSLG